MSSISVNPAQLFVYMEETEYAFLRSVGLSVVLTDSRGKIGFPRIEVSADFRQPARHGDVLDIRMTISGTDGKTLQYQFDVVRHDELVARGQFKVACCRFLPRRRPYAIPIPDDVLDRISRD